MAIMKMNKYENISISTALNEAINEVINESLEDTLIKDKLKVNSTYETEDGFKFKYIGTQLIDEVLFYKFKPLSDKAKEITSEIAEDEDLPNDGFAYMTGETVFYTFFD